MSLDEHKILQDSVEELLKKASFKIEKSLCNLELLVPQKDGTMRMSLDSIAINKITI